MDETFMREALAEARKGLGFTHPNPAVGAVIVRAGRIVSRGWHKAAGGPHAEIAAIRNAARTQGATLYVTLEPCSTQGRTPPCTEAIIAAEFERVVYGATDPNPRHVGRAKRLLEKSGIAVTEGVLSEECAALNAGWNKWISTGRPWVIAKAGMSLDGRLNSPPEHRWLTSPASRRDAMKLRARVQAILVGAETVRADDPQLTIRDLRHLEQPLRVVWTKSGTLPRKAKLFTDEFRDRTLVFQNRSLRSVLRELGKRDVASVLIEGGARVLGEAFDHGLVDEVSFYLAPLLIGGPVPVTGGRGAGSNGHAIRLDNPTYSHIGSDVKLTGKVRRHAKP
jgi:diaminohydroxyphosphoribosylaminopyrimidine deaminase/5-amino-6-(5-phosphoribosylamino)uracil reductase